MYSSGPTHAHDTHHAYMERGTTSKSCLGFRMSEFPPLLLEKRATASSLSQNLFWQLQAQTIKQGCSYELKQPNKSALTSLKGYIYLWCSFEALASNFSEWYLSSISISTCSSEALALG